ncbi:MAG: O-methyltransferase [Ignavibacteriales bacterium]|nr:O-methyltransferase [Ignavibacteriales bacterium]
MSNILYDDQVTYLTSLRNDPELLLTEMEKFAAEKKIPILDWMSAEFLEQLVLVTKPKSVLEIGTAIGYSSIRIARKLRKKASLDTIERSKNNIKLAKEYIKRAKLTSSINILEGDALEIMPRLNKKYDLIFLDADKEDYEKLFHYSLILLKKGGVLFVDNLLWHGYAAAKSVPESYKKSTKIIREFNKMFINSTLLHSTILSIGDGIGLGVKS